MMASSTREQIQDAASRNNYLLTSLHETDSASSQLAQQTSYIADLHSQIQKTTAHVSNLKKATAAELKDHKKYSESTFRRFAHKASGRKDRFEEKAAKEEREYFDAIQAQKTGEDQLAYLQALKSEAEITRSEYEKQAQRHSDLQRELDALYDSIFAGPTPGFPDEDAKERTCAFALQNVQHLSANLEKVRHILFLLGQIALKLTEAGHHLDDAHSLSQMDLFGGGTLASMQKRNYLERAESTISQVRMLQNQLQHVGPPGVADLGPVDIASGSIWGDIVFDNIFSDMEMHEKIKASELQIGEARRKISDKIRKAEGREQECQRELDAAGERLQYARRDLQRAREEAFTRVTGDDSNVGVPTSAGPRPPECETAAPPAYSA